METLIQDVRFGLRALRLRPVFAAVAIATLALGVGANALAFTVVTNVLFRSVPFPEPARLYSVWGSSREQPNLRAVLSYPDYLAVAEQARSFATTGGAWFRTYQLTGSGEPEQLQAFAVTADFFRTLGATPLLGRFVGAADTAASGPKSAVLSYEFWRKRFGADSSILNRSILLNGEPTTVVGVTREGQGWPGYASAWTPLRSGPADRADRSSSGGILVRLRPGAAAESAEREVAAIGRRLAQDYPKENRGWDLRLISLRDYTVGDVRSGLLALTAAVACVLLTTCTNIAHMLLARGAQREREIALRAALGAGRRRLARQFLTEAFLLAAVGTALGVALAAAMLPAALRLNPVALPGQEAIHVDVTLLAFALAAVVITGLAFGALPALRAGRANLVTSLRAAGGAAPSSGRFGPRSLLVVSQVALAMVLLVGAGLLGKSLSRLQRIDPGFTAGPVVTVGLVLPDARYPTAEAKRAFFRNVSEQLEAVPDVAAAGAINFLPLSGGDLSVKVWPASGGRDDPTAMGFRAVTPGYFKAMGVPLHRGRPFAPSDVKAGVQVAIVNEAGVRALNIRGNPIGQAARLSLFGEPPQEIMIVGTVADVKHDGLTQETKPEVYRPYEQTAFGYMNVVARSRSDRPTELLPAVRRAIHSVDPSLALFAEQVYGEVLRKQSARPRFATAVMGSFACLALGLAAIGLFGVMAVNMAMRRREVGIRLALGQPEQSVILTVLRPGLVMIGVGVAVGLVLAIAMGGVIRSLLFQVRQYDPAVLAGVALVLSAVGALAAYLPIRQAASVSPVEALQTE